jgi:predicted esterase
MKPEPPSRVSNIIMESAPQASVTTAQRPLRLLLMLLLCGTAPAQEPPTGHERPDTGEFVLGLTLADLVSPETAEHLAGIIAADERIDWQVYVPASYDPSQPAGLLVYISPTPSGEIPRGWKPVLDEHNVIWIGADRSGNSELVARRVLFALLATSAIRRQYAIDEERVYLTGLSGGGKTASMVATDQAQLFRGAIYNCGVEFWDQEPERIELIRQNHYVFVTGTYDQALRPTKRAHRSYLKAGVENSKLMVINKMTHRNPDSFEFEEALKYLDSRLQPDR